MTRLFLAIGVVLGVTRYAIVRARARRAALRTAESIPWGVRLQEPTWSRASGPLAVLAFAAALCGVASFVRQPGIGAGMAGTIVLAVVAVHRVAERWSARAIAFAADGLQVHLRGARFLIRWEDVADVEPTANRELAELNVLSVRRALASVEPNDDRARTRASSALYDGTGVTGRLLLPGALASVDGATLAKALAAAAQRRGGSAVN